MKEFLKKYKFLILFFSFIFCGCGENSLEESSKSIEVKNKTENLCKKEDNCCIKNEDCEFITYTGGCFTWEYVSKKLEEAKKTKTFIGEDWSKKDKKITCTCENNKCITHEEK